MPDARRAEFAKALLSAIHGPAETHFSERQRDLKWGRASLLKTVGASSLKRRFYFLGQNQNLISCFMMR